MGKHDECQTPFTKCWCEAVPGRMNNPHCQSLMPSVSIQSDGLTVLSVLIILYYVWLVFYKNPKPLTEYEIQENLKWKLFWISLSDRWIFNKNAFYKEYFKKDGTLKNIYKETL